MHPEVKYQQANGVKLAYFERGEPSADRPTILFVHATGFHGRLWDYQAEALADYHTIALEQRGHGRSEKVGANHWHTYAEDLAAFIRALELKNIIAVGHSMGAHAIADSYGLVKAYNQMILLDPVIVDPASYVDDDLEDFAGQLHPASKRRAEFASTQAMHDSLVQKSSFPRFHPRIFNDYCTYGAESIGDTVRLCCEPEIEAGVYMSSRTNGRIHEVVPTIDIPVTIVRAKIPKDDGTIDFSSSPTWPGLVERLPQGRELFWSDCSHFVPMERPDDVVQIIREAIARWQSR